MLDDGLAARHGAALAHVNRSLEHKGKARRHFTRLHDGCARREDAHFAEAAEARKVMVAEDGEYLVAPRVHDGFLFGCRLGRV